MIFCWTLSKIKWIINAFLQANCTNVNDGKTMKAADIVLRQTSKVLSYYMTNLTRNCQIKISTYIAKHTIILNIIIINLRKVISIILKIYKIFVPFQRQSPSDDGNIFWQTHWQQHFRTEHTGITHLYPFL